MEEIETQLDEATLDACINIESAHYRGNGGGIIEEAKSEAADHDTIRNSADDNDNDNDKVPMSLSCIVTEEIEMTVDAEEPLTSIMLSLMPSKSISPSGLKEISPAPVPTPVPPPLALPLASPLASPVLSVPKSAPKSTPAPVNKCSPNKLNTSALTTETAESSILNDSTELETSMNTTNNMNTSIQSRMLISSDIFIDAFDQLTDIAVDFGFVAADNSTIFADEDDIVEKEAAGAEGIIPIEQEEPGRIFQSTGTNSLDDDSASPFDEEKALNISLPFDEMPSTRITKKKSEDLSAIARIRYRQHQQDEGLTTARTHPEPESAAKPYEDIQRERHEKWRKNRQQATREEEQTMQIDEECDRDDLQEIEIPQLSLSRTPKKDKMKESTSASAPISDDPDTIEDFGLLELDISILTKPIEDAWMQSQAVLMEAVLGQKIDGDQYDDSDYDDDSYFSEDSSHYSEDDDISSQGSTSRGRRSRRSGKIIGKGRGSVTYSNDESESDEDFECHGSPSKSGHGGHNRNFLDEITGDGINLVWHRPRSSPSSKRFSCEVLVKIQISDAGGTEENAEPNLVWEVVDKGRRRMRYQATPRETISLFNIATIQKAADSIKLNMFPDADPYNSIMITLNDGSLFLFEAESVIEAKKVIHGLRWIEARLTFNLIAGNIHVCSEMLSMNQTGVSELTSDIFIDVTNQLVQKSLNKLS